MKESSGEGGVYWKISGEGNHTVVWDRSRQGSPGHPDQLDQRGDKKEREREMGDEGPGTRLQRGPGL